jgi:ABC-type uncharacterized transport system permease subunit
MLVGSLRRNLGLYFYMMVNEARRYMSYPLEIVSSVLKRLMAPVLLIVFWYAVGSHSNSTISPKDLVAYTLVANGLTQVFSSDFKIAGIVQKMIKYGEISHMMLRPSSILLQTFAKYTGRNIADGVVNGLFVVIGLIVGGTSFSTIGYLPFVLINALVLNMSFNLLLGTLGFYTPGASAIKNTINHVIQLLRGSTIPFYLVAPVVIKILNFTPFPASMYHVVLALRGRAYLLRPVDVAIGTLWAVLILAVSMAAWRRSTRSYEAVGL